jgi:hypothetical protein
MAHITADRVRDTTTSTGTGALTVSGSAPSGYNTFSNVASTSDTFYYAIQHQAASEWEVGLGTYSSANTISRTTVYSSSNSGSAVNFSAGTKDIFITLPASRTVQRDNAGNITGLVVGTNVQAYDADLDAIGALSGTSGILKKTAANTWTLDTASYLASSAIGSTVQAWDADLDTWATKTAPSGTVVGTSDTQTLSGKTLTTAVSTGHRETRVAVSGTDIDLATGNYFTKTISGSTTFTVSNVPASGTVGAFILELTNPGTAVTWWSGVKWVSGTQPTWTVTGTDILAFYTIDGGTTWRAFAVGKDSK